MDIVVGGPHATYFPKECLKYADYVVLSHGIDGFRRILKNEVDKGIVELLKSEQFPISNRDDFYKNYPKHKKSPIKSIITQTGCPYSCNYCYNSSTLENIEGITKEQKQNMKNILSKSGKLFPKIVRSVDDIIEEIDDIKRVSPETQMIYFQDDVFVGMDYEWIKEFSRKFQGLGLNFHAQVRFEFANPKNYQTKEKLELMRKAGCTGLTVAIESANPIIRKEVLNRPMREDLMFDVLSYLDSLGYKVRTEQMLGLPCGATTKKTPINLEADLETLRLNVKLKEQTNLPTMAWASVFAPYRGTVIGNYCKQHGFYDGKGNDTPETFFQKSILNFPKQWIGPELLSKRKEYWLSSEEQESYKNRLQILRDFFDFFAETPKGDELAKEFLNKEGDSYNFNKEMQDFSFALSTSRRRHLYDNVLYEI